MAMVNLFHQRHCGAFLSPQPLWPRQANLMRRLLGGFVFALISGFASPIDGANQGSSNFSFAGSVVFDTYLERGSSITAFSVQSSSKESAFIKINSDRMRVPNTPANLWGRRLATAERVTLSFITVENSEQAVQYLPAVTQCSLTPNSRMRDKASYAVMCFDVEGTAVENGKINAVFVAGLDAPIDSAFDRWLRAAVTRASAPAFLIALS